MTGILDKFYDSLKTCCSPFEQRYVVTALLACGILSNYIQRISFYIALVELTNRERASPTDFRITMESTWERCPHIFLKSSEGAEGDFKDWSDAVQGYILASFYVGYVFSSFAGGYISDKYGAKHVLGVSVILTSACSVVTPFVAKVGPYLLMFIRSIMGLAQGPMFPAANAILTKWSPRQERSFLNTIANSAVPLSSFLGNLLSGIILAILPWNWVFYIFSAFGVFWYILWEILVFSSPRNHKFITLGERAYIEHSIFYDSPAATGGVPYKAILTSFKFQVVAWANFGFDWGFYIISMELPFYLRNVLNLPIIKIGVVSSLPWLSMWMGAILFGFISHFLIAEGIMRKIDMRKIMGFISTIVPGVLLILGSWASCSHVLVCLLFSSSMFYAGAAYSGIRISIVDLSPNYAGTCTSIINNFGAVSGVLVPVIVHSMIHEGGTLMEWRISFWIATTFMLVTPIPYLLFVTTTIQPWNIGLQAEAPHPPPDQPPAAPPPSILDDELIRGSVHRTTRSIFSFSDDLGVLPYRGRSLSM